MDKNLHDIEWLFHSALNDNEETPSEDTWEKIDKQLDKDNIVTIKRKYTKVKRIAVFLLLVLLGFVVYDVYKTNMLQNINDFAKNKYNDSDEQKQLDRKADKISNEKTESTSAAVAGKENAAIYKEDHIVLNDPLAADKKSMNKKQPALTSNYSLKNRNIDGVPNSVKNQSNLSETQNKKHHTRLPYRVSNTNAVLAEDKQILVQDTYELENNQVQSLRRLGKVSMERLKKETANFINAKKILLPITAARIKVAGADRIAVSKNKKANSSRFFVTAFFSPDIAWYRLKDNNESNQQDNASEIEKEEKHDFSSTFGALVDYKINKHWGLQSGLTLSNINITVQPKTIYAQPDNTGSIKFRINSSSGYGYVLPSYIMNPSIGDSLYAFTSSHSLQYVGIPLAVTYNIVKGKFDFNVMAGLSFNILTSAKLETSVENGVDNSYETIHQLQGLQKTYFSGIAGIGSSYKLTKKTAVIFAPVIRFALNSINKNAVVKSYPMSFGIAVGLKIEL